MALKPHYKGERASVLVLYEQYFRGLFLGPRSFNIVWGSDARYWRLPTQDEEGPAELVKVSWLEVSRKSFIPRLMRGERYEISFSISLKSDAFGWSDCPIYVMAKFGKEGKYICRKIDQLHQITSFPAKIPIEKLEIQIPTTPADDDDDDDNELYFGLYEVWTGIAKGGLLIHNAKVELVH